MPDCRSKYAAHDWIRTCRRPAKEGLRSTSDYSIQRKRDASIENAGFQPGDFSYREAGYRRWLDRINSHYYRHKAALNRIDTRPMRGVRDASLGLNHSNEPDAHTTNSAATFPKALSNAATAAGALAAAAGTVAPKIRRPRFAHYRQGPWLRIPL